MNVVDFSLFCLMSLDLLLMSCDFIDMMRYELKCFLIAGGIGTEFVLCFKIIMLKWLFL